MENELRCLSCRLSWIFTRQKLLGARLKAVATRFVLEAVKKIKCICRATGPLLTGVCGGPVFLREEQVQM